MKNRKNIKDTTRIDIQVVEGPLQIIFTQSIVSRVFDINFNAAADCRRSVVL